MVRFRQTGRSRRPTGSGSTWSPGLSGSWRRRAWCSPCRDGARTSVTDARASQRATRAAHARNTSMPPLRRPDHLRARLLAGRDRVHEGRAGVQGQERPHVPHLERILEVLRALGYEKPADPSAAIAISPPAARQWGRPRRGPGILSEDILIRTTTLSQGHGPGTGKSMMDGSRRRRTKDHARKAWYAHHQQRRFARFLGFPRPEIDVAGQPRRGTDSTAFPFAARRALSDPAVSISTTF